MAFAGSNQDTKNNDRRWIVENMSEKIDFNQCKDCETAEFIEMQELWRNHRGEIYIVVCRRCGDFVPCKIEPWLRDQELYKKLKEEWNTRSEK